MTATPPDKMPNMELAQLLVGLGASQADIVVAFARQIVTCHDPEAVQAFLVWRDDPRMESLMQIAATLDDEGLDQLVFTAEDLFAQTLKR